MAHLFVEINGVFDFRYHMSYCCHGRNTSIRVLLTDKKKSMKGNRELGNYWVLTIKITYLEYLYIKDVSQKEK